MEGKKKSLNTCVCITVHTALTLLSACTSGVMVSELAHYWVSWD